VSEDAPYELLRVFIVGCPRSGTTLLQALLGANREVASFPESHLFLKPRGVRSRLAGGWRTRMGLERFARTVEAGALYESRRFALGQRPYQRDFIRLLDQITRARQKRVWIEKTPNHVLNIPEIRKLAPSSRFVHLIRDGRAVVASLYEVTRTWGGPMGLKECVAEWNRAIAASSTAMQTGGDGIVVSYEMLAADPMPEMERLCEFLSLQYDPQMVSAHSTIVPAIVGSQEIWKDRVDGPIHDFGLEKYREIFSHEQQALIEDLLISLPANLRHE
jgi:Sulfotransferase family